jgi:uncharacterized protein YndB with AHSA1/START domain
VTRTIALPIDVVFDAVADPGTYPHWLVGARDIRSVDPAWPAPGSTFHHRVGLIGPLKVADSTRSLAVDPPHLLALEVRARPFGRGRATFRLRARDGEATEVEVDEEPLGLLSWATPVLDPLTAHRNRVSLSHLEDFLLHGTSHRAPG